jgi:hypothetical protein
MFLTAEERQEETTQRNTGGLVGRSKCFNDCIYPPVSLRVSSRFSAVKKTRSTTICSTMCL